MYAITAQVVHHTTDGLGRSSCISRQVPTFFLDEHVQGIVDEQHAEKIAREIVCPFQPQYESVEVHITVVKV